jgi:hypothetical protein
MGVLAMTAHLFSRIATIDEASAKRVLASWLHAKEKTLNLIRSEPERLKQTRYASLAMEFTEIGLFHYALGFALDEVRDDFLEAARAHLVVIELRGTEAPFPVTVLRFDPARPNEPPQEIARPDPAAKDYSSGNSKQAMEAAMLALIAGEHALAGRLALSIWDPPNARYIGPESEVCTPNELHLASALRELFKADKNAAAKELAQVRMRRKREGNILPAKKMLEGIAKGERGLFVQGLEGLLEWHAEEAQRPNNPRYAEFYLCLPGLGLTILAIRAGLVKLDDLPADNVYLPRSLF